MDEKLVFIARKKSTGVEREFTFDDLYGYEGEVCGVLFKPDEKDPKLGCWVLNYNSGYDWDCGMNPDLEIRLKN